MSSVCRAFLFRFPKSFSPLLRGGGDGREICRAARAVRNKICAFLLTFAANGEIMETKKILREVLNMYRTFRDLFRNLYRFNRSFLRLLFRGL